MDDHPRLEYYPVRISDEIPISLPAFEWIQIFEWIRWAEIPGREGQAPIGVSRLLHEISGTFVSEASLKAHNAHARNREQNSVPWPFSMMVPQVPDPESFGESGEPE